MNKYPINSKVIINSIFPPTQEPFCAGMMEYIGKEATVIDYTYSAREGYGWYMLDVDGGRYYWMEEMLDEAEQRFGDYDFVIINPDGNEIIKGQVTSEYDIAIQTPNCIVDDKINLKCYSTPESTFKITDSIGIGDKLRLELTHDITKKPLKLENAVACIIDKVNDEVIFKVDRNKYEKAIHNYIIKY